MGDLDVVEPLVARAASPWRFEYDVAMDALYALEAVHGQAALVAALGADSLPALAFDAVDEAHRLIGVRLLDDDAGDVTPALADPSVVVAREAYERRADDYISDDGPLLDLVERRAPGHLWALAVLHRHGHPIRDAWESLGPPVVELPGVPTDVRQAILCRYAPGQRQTDPRWLLEAACLPPASGPSGPELVDRAVTALAAAGLEPGAPRDAAVYGGNIGVATYYSIPTRDGPVWVCTLGPYFDCRTGVGADVLRAMGGAGFRVIDGELADTVVTGLHVYWFGDRREMTVGELLFYWQD
jgi:hypothetical protein